MPRLIEIVSETVRVDQVSKKNKRGKEREKEEEEGRGGEEREPCSTALVIKRT